MTMLQECVVVFSAEDAMAPKARSRMLSQGTAGICAQTLLSSYASSQITYSTIEKALGISNTIYTGR